MKNKQIFITFQLKERKNHDRNRRVEDKVMGRKKEDLSIFEQMGGTYTEKDGILYPNIRIGEEETEAMQNTFSRRFMEKVSERKPAGEILSSSLFRAVETKSAEINEEANELLERIMQQYLQKHKPENPDSTMEMWQLREQAKAMAEEVVLQDIVYCYH